MTENGVPEVLDGQISIYDAAASAVARDEAIHRVDEHAGPEWKEEAYEAVCRCAFKFREFTTDQVWQEIPDDVEPPHEPRAMGAVMTRAMKAGIVRQSERWRQTTRVASHRRPMRIWISTL